MNKKHLSWIELDIKKLHHNIQVYKEQLEKTNIAPVVKSNAYGHGIIEIAQQIEHNTSVETLCVVTSEEGVILRKNNIQKKNSMHWYLQFFSRINRSKQY